MTLKLRLEHGLLIGIFFLGTFLVVGSFESRLANTIGDDHPLVWARYFSQPEFWQGDGLFVMAKSFSRASLPNLLASLSIHWNEKFPFLLSWAYLFIQNLGLGLALYLLLRAFGQDRWTSAAVSLFTYSLSPWQNNLAYYPSLIHSPYPGHLVMPFLVLALGFLIQNKRTEMAASLTVAALIHPSQTLQCLFLLGVLFLIENNFRFNLKEIPFFLIPTLACLSIPLFWIPKSLDPLTDRELLPSALSNPHLVPWESTTFWPWGMPSLIGVFILSFFACRPLAKQKNSLSAFWWANLISLLVMGALHFFGVYFKILPIILLCPFRISVINSVFLAAVGVNYLLKKITSQDWGVAWSAASLLFLLVFSKAGLFWGPLLALGISEAQKKETSLWSKWVFVLWWALFWLVGRPVRKLLGSDVSGALRVFLAPGASLTLNSLVWIFLLSLLTFLVIRTIIQNKKERIGPLFWFATGCATMGMVAYHVGREAYQDDVRSRLSVEQWAREATPKQSLFLMENGSWRGISQRRAQAIGYSKDHLLPYFRDRESKDLELKIEKTYLKFQIKAFEKLPDEGILELAREFKGNYLIEEVTHPSRSFPIVFTNQKWRVYALPLS